MSIHRRGDRWEVRWREGSRNRSRTLDRKSDAERFDAEARRKKQIGGVVPSRTGGQTLEDFAAHWLAGRTNLTPDTQGQYEYFLDHYVIEHIGFQPVSSLRPATIEDWQREMLAKGTGKEALAKAVMVLRQVLDAAVRRELLQANPAASLELPKIQRRVPTPATPEQVEGIRAYFLNREEPMIGDATLVSLLAYVGSRPGETLELRWSDVDKMTITLHASKTGTTRVVRPPRQVFQDLATWKLRTPSPFGLVFPRRKDGEVWSKDDWRNWRQRKFAKAAEAAGLEDFRPYDLRHSRASMLAAQGTSVLDIQVAAREMGHSVAMFLSTYAHLIEQARDRQSVSAEQWIAEARSEKRGEATGS